MIGFIVSVSVVITVVIVLVFVFVIDIYAAQNFSRFGRLCGWGRLGRCNVSRSVVFGGSVCRSFVVVRSVGSVGWGWVVFVRYAGAVLLGLGLVGRGSFVRLWRVYVRFRAGLRVGRVVALRYVRLAKPRRASAARRNEEKRQGRGGCGAVAIMWYKPSISEKKKKRKRKKSILSRFKGVIFCGWYSCTILQLKLLRKPVKCLKLNFMDVGVGVILLKLRFLG